MMNAGFDLAVLCLWQALEMLKYDVNLVLYPSGTFELGVGVGYR